MGAQPGESLTVAGADHVLNGHQGNDAVYGGAGRDLLVGGGGSDLFRAGSGNDRLEARDGLPFETVDGQGGNDTCEADLGDFLISC